jgi:hypothetical protein
LAQRFDLTVTDGRVDVERRSMESDPAE